MVRGPLGRTGKHAGRRMAGIERCVHTGQFCHSRNDRDGPVTGLCVYSSRQKVGNITVLLFQSNIAGFATKKLPIMNRLPCDKNKVVKLAIVF